VDDDGADGDEGHGGEFPFQHVSKIVR
jgi:hypothetical protein